LKRPTVDRFNYRVVLAYRGTDFAGYARQPGLDTVEGAVLEALAAVAPDVRGLSVGGRTDRGVHALGQVISFWSRAPRDVRAIEEAIDAARPDALAALEVRRVARPFHAQHSATLRRYLYVLEDVHDLDVARLDRMLAALVGRRCFGAFARDTPAGQPTVRTLYTARAVQRGDGVHVELCGDGFLRRQVRVLVGTALRELARPDTDDEALVTLAAAGDRAATAEAAAPGGLYLVKVGYHAMLATSRRGHVLVGG